MPICAYCKKPFIKERGYQFTCLPPRRCWLYVPDILKKRELSAQKKITNAKNKILREQAKQLPDFKDDLVVEIKIIAGLIDFMQPCLSTGLLRVEKSEYPFSDNETIRFDLHNWHRHKIPEKRPKKIDKQLYAEGIKKVYGSDYLEYLESLKPKPLRITVEEIKKKILLAKSLKKGLRKKPYVHDAETRIKLRHEYNKKLGIYK